MTGHSILSAHITNATWFRPFIRAFYDLQFREMVWSALRKLLSEGCSIILTTHYLEEAEALADRVAVLAKGRLIANGTVSEMRALVVRKRITCRTRLSCEQVSA